MAAMAAGQAVMVPDTVEEVAIAERSISKANQHARQCGLWTSKGAASKPNGLSITSLTHPTASQSLWDPDPDQPR